MEDKNIEKNTNLRKFNICSYIIIDIIVTFIIGTIFTGDGSAIYFINRIIGNGIFEPLIWILWFIELHLIFIIPMISTLLLLILNLLMLPIFKSKKLIDDNNSSYLKELINNIFKVFYDVSDNGSCMINGIIILDIGISMQIMDLIDFWGVVFLHIILIIPFVSYLIFYLIYALIDSINPISKKIKKENQKKDDAPLLLLSTETYLKSIKDEKINEFYDSIESNVTKFKEEIKENKDIYVYNNLALDEQNDYLKNVDALINEKIKYISNLILKDINKNEKNNFLNLYCDSEVYDEFIESIKSNLNNVLEITEVSDEQCDIQSNIYYFEFRLRDYLNLVNFFNYKNIPCLPITHITYSYDKEDGIKSYFEYNLAYDLFVSSENPSKEINDNIEFIVKDDGNIFLVSNLKSDFYESIKSDIDSYTHEIANYAWKNRDRADEFMLYIQNLTIQFLYKYNKELLFNYHLIYRELCSILDDFIDDLDKNKGIIFSGVKGEELVEREFDIYKDELKYFSNIRFEDGNNSVETDGLILSERGIFSIEIKNFKFPKIKISKDGQWKKCYYGPGGELIEEVMKDVGAQMNRHIIITERLFNEHLKSKKIKDRIEIKPMIIIANDQIEIENESDMIVARASQIYPNFKKSDCNYSKKALSEIEKFINENKLPPKKYEILNYEKTFENVINMFLNKKEEITKMFNEILKNLNEELPNIIENFNEEENDD